MKKNVILITILLFSLFILNYIAMPKVNYSIISDYTLKGYKNQSLDEELTESKKEGDPVVLLQLSLDYDQYKSKKSDLGKSVDNYKENKKEFRNDAKKYHKGNNERIISKTDLKNYQNFYISEFSPFIDITYDYNYYVSHKYEILESITSNKYVKEVTVVEDVIEYNECMDYVIRACNVEDVVTNRTKTGDGVVVGILEPGVVKRNDELLQDVDITIRPNALNLLGHQHTTEMAQLIAGSTGIAPGVKLLSAYLTLILAEEIDWMLDHDVDIINMSCDDMINGRYTIVSAYADYIVYTYDVIIVAALGNDGNGDGLIHNPALGYNVITVGSCNASAKPSSFNSYTTYEGPIKPTVCVPGEMVFIREDSSDIVYGTSISTALCSGMIALLLEDYPVLASEQERLIALITTNADFSIFNDFEQANGFDFKAGAGLFNYQNIIDHYNTSFNYTNTSGQPDTIHKSRLVYLQQGQTLRASFAHLAKADGTVNGTIFTDYDLYIKNMNGEILQSYVDHTTNVMLATFVAPETGYYKIEIQQYSEKMDTIDYTAMAYSILN